VHRGRLLKVDADTSTRGVLERLLGLFGEIVELETVNGDQSGIDTVRAQACQRGADAKANTILGGGALEVGNHCLLEDGSERGGALVSDAVVPDTTRDVWGHSERAGACQRALTQKRTLYRAATYRRVVICVSLRTAASAEAPSAPMRLFPILRGIGVGAQ